MIGVGTLGRYIAMAAGQAGTNTETFDSPDAAAGGAADLLCAGDVVLIKASRAVGLERLVEPIRQAFDGPSRRKA